LESTEAEVAENDSDVDVDDFAGEKNPNKRDISAPIFIFLEKIVKSRGIFSKL
jgi:hypothetical protein